VLYVDEGNIITSAGSAAGIDACLHLVRRDFGPRVANIVARRMVIPPHREGGQAQYVQAPVSVRTESTVSSAIEWARHHINQPISITEMVARSAMSGRTFQRQFKNAVGMTPNRWLQTERVSRAKELLETTPMKMSRVAAQCGYESAETFRIAFKRIVGVAPGAYRNRFSGQLRAYVR
ncbi:MAG: helix-turn-helix domain-containing protein, partial [Burkholderiales bacterium]